MSTILLLLSKKVCCKARCLRQEKKYIARKVIIFWQIYVASGGGYTLPYLGTEAYIRHHLLHKSARKLLEMSEINGLSEIILRFLEEKCDMTVIFTFSVNILSTNY